MKSKYLSVYSRKAHRYLGLFIGIQFILWTIGGLYFSWTDIDEIHGDHLRPPQAAVSAESATIPAAEAVSKANLAEGGKELREVRLVSLFGETYYEVRTRKPKQSERSVLVHAASGTVRGELSQEEAERIARSGANAGREVASAEYLTEANVGSHHEYREKPLPAWAVTFAGSEGPTIYISADTGQVGAVRTNKWRIFDFLWMLHTMDFNGRDNLNNYVLRAFSILGLTTVLSGFLLFAVSSPRIRRFFRR